MRPCSLPTVPAPAAATGRRRPPGSPPTCPELQHRPARVEQHRHRQREESRPEGVTPAPIATAQAKKRHPGRDREERVFGHVSRLFRGELAPAGHGDQYRRGDVAHPHRPQLALRRRRGGEVFPPVAGEHHAQQPELQSLAGRHVSDRPVVPQQDLLGDLRGHHDDGEPVEHGAVGAELHVVLAVFQRPGDAVEDVEGAGVDRFAVEVALQVVRQRRGRRVAVRRLFLQTFQTDRLQIAVHLGVEQARRGRQLLHHLRQRVERRLGAERRPARQHFVQSAPRP